MTDLITNLVRAHVKANPGLPSTWVARLILAEIPGAGDNNEYVAWAVREQITAMVREARDEDAGEVEVLSDDPEVLLNEAAAMEAHAGALMRYRDTLNREGGPADAA